MTDPFGDLSDFHITHEPPPGYEKYRDLNIQHVVENALYKGDFTIRQNGIIEGTMENCNPYSTGNGEVKEYASNVGNLTDSGGLISDVKIKIRAFNLLRMYTDLCFKVKGLGVFSKEIRRSFRVPPIQRWYSNPALWKTWGCRLGLARTE